MPHSLVLRALVVCAALAVAVPVRAQPAGQTADRVNAPFPVSAVLSAADLVEALAGVCGDECVEVLQAPRGWGGATQLAVAVATPPDGPPVTARAWRPGTIAAEDLPGAEVPERATATAWRGGQRRDWNVFGRYSAFVELAPGRTLEAGPAASREVLDAALDAVRTEPLAQPARSAFVAPGAADLLWTPEEAAEAARRQRPRVVARVPLDVLYAALPASDTLNALAYVDAAPFRDVLSHIAVLAVYPEGFREQYAGNSPPLAQLLLISTDPAPDAPEATLRVQGYPASEAAEEQPRTAYYRSYTSSSRGEPLAEMPIVRAVEVAVAPGRIAHAVGPDTLLADRLLAAADLAALESAATARAVESPELYYSRAATPYEGVYADDRAPGTVVSTLGDGPPVRFRLAPDRYAIGLGSYCYSAGAGALLAVVAARPLAPCEGASAEEYPDSPAADLARADGLVVVRDHGASAAVRLAWAESWPAYRRSLLPAWAIPLDPQGEPARQRLGARDALAFGAVSDGSRVPGDPFAVHALLVDLDGRLVSVAAGAPTASAARDLAESLAATLAPATP